VTTRLDKTLIDRWRKDGFLAFDSGLPASDIASLRQTLVRLHEENVGYEEGALFDATGVDDGSAPARFPQILHPRSFAPELVDSRFFRMAHAIAEQILGGGVRFKADISLMKPARIGDPTPWHQDEAFQAPEFDYEEVSLASGWRCNQLMKPIVAWHISPARIRDQCCHTAFPAATRGFTPLNASAVSARKMPSRVRCRQGVASSITGGRYMERGPMFRIRTGWRMY
jgi:hypothetical protein